MRAIQVSEYGGPEVLRAVDLPVPGPKPGEALVRLEAAGVNFIDVYQRTGLYRGALPFVPGNEGAGRIEAVGEGVIGLKRGDRVAWATHQGAYAEYAVVPAWKLVPVPEGIDLTHAAAIMLQGMTAHYLTHSTFRLEPGHTALVHAAAGGVGLLLIQLAKRAGAFVIGTVSTEEKERLARDAGADAVIRYTEQDFTAETKRLTGGRGVHVVYDSVGKTTFQGSLEALRPRGMMALYGQSSGPVPPFDPQVLNQKGSLFLTRPSLFHYVQDREELLGRARDLFDAMLEGSLKLRIDRQVPLADAGSAHRALEARETAGKLLLDCTG